MSAHAAQRGTAARDAAAFVPGAGAAQAVDAAFAHAHAAAAAAGKPRHAPPRLAVNGTVDEPSAIGWKLGGPRMHAVCGCKLSELLSRAVHSHRAKVIYLHREDSVAVALSLESARRSSVYVLPRGRETPPQGAQPASAPPATNASERTDKRPMLIEDVPAFAERAAWFETHSRTFPRTVDRAIGHSSSVSPALLSLSYEQLLAAPLAQTRRVFAFLGLPACDVALAAATARIGGRPLAQQVSNVEEVCKALAARGLHTAMWRESCTPRSETIL